MFRAIKALTLASCDPGTISPGTLSFAPAIARALDSQTAVGWENLFRGLVSKEWGNIYSTSDTMPALHRHHAVIKNSPPSLPPSRTTPSRYDRVVTLYFTSLARMDKRQSMRSSTCQSHNSTDFAIHSLRSSNVTSRPPPPLRLDFAAHHNIALAGSP